MRILKNISGHMHRDRKRNYPRRMSSKRHRWRHRRRREWTNHISRMDVDRVARITRNRLPLTRRPMGLLKNKKILGH